MSRYATRAGWHFPARAIPDAGGVNFCIFSRDAAAAELRLFETADSDVPSEVIALDPDVHRTFFFRHVYVEAVGPGLHYSWRVAGKGQTLDSTLELLDPWARAVSDHLPREHLVASRQSRNVDLGRPGCVAATEP
ncbi:MAG TPA: hypothetical protein VMG60_00165 [Burkholderiaceae bacterium]|nr:hypothetical protein [Burkholderiaceae bacterium]